MPPPPVWVVVDDHDLFEPIRRPGHPRRTILRFGAARAAAVPPPPVLQLSAAEVAAGGASFASPSERYRARWPLRHRRRRTAADAGAASALAGEALRPPPVRSRRGGRARWAAAVRPRSGSGAGRRRATIPSSHAASGGGRAAYGRGDCVDVPATSSRVALPIDVAHIVVTKAPLVPLDAAPAAGPVDGGAEVRVTAAGVASAAPLYCAFGDAPPVAARPRWRRRPRARARRRRGRPGGARLLQNDSYGGLLVSVLRGHDDDEAAAAMLGRRRRRSTNWTAWAGGRLLPELGIPRTTEGAFGWRQALEKDHMQLAAYDPPRAVTAAELAALGVSGRQRALLLKHDALPSPPFPFEYYATPSLVLSRPTADRRRRLHRTVRGRGFRALTHGGVAGGNGRAAQPVCRFGTTAAAATVASDALVRCVAPWGVGGRRSRVSLALERRRRGGRRLWLTFEGRSRAHVVAATLADDATTVSLRFGTPTDRGGATPASRTARLSRQRVARPRRRRPRPDAWPSARELRVRLGAAAPLRAGDAIAVRARV